MSTSIATESTSSSGKITLEEYKLSQQQSDPLASFFHPVHFCGDDDVTDISTVSRSTDDSISEKLSKMELQQSNSGRIPKKQNKVIKKPYSRKTVITPPRTPEVSRNPRNRPHVKTIVKSDQQKPVNKEKATQP
ncbi:uncharacterized protein MELLADRAFT_104427 [Melampsora larici-populina 98AG31]|uniref:Uncharacterized protein n=1 Tax=Melampsora larici-populina (strain 98AG31 / pathotype 3-4-7) TaxID=747676 RepID=F4REN4_MELLP|nr:uncharacterized protein MELLADRAFT_104427 [Melampsora larici-populina 98AG31]EGG09249.1 hypothetical protein MELLADRAFT_104427 [Melampsora larici-populina 98AG31]